MTTFLPIIRYLAELDAALAARSVADRDQIVQQISEHIEAALAEIPHPSGTDVAAILADLGDPLVIAQESAGVPGGTSSPRPPGPEREVRKPSSLTGAARVSILNRPWIPLVALIPFLLAEVQCMTRLLISGHDGLRGVITFTLIAVLLNLWWWASLAVVIASPLFCTRVAVYWGASLPVTMLIVPPVARDLLDSPHPVDALIGNLVAFGLPVAVAVIAVLITVRATGHAQVLLNSTSASSART